MTTVKICGLKSAETLQLLTDLEVDYAGFVFAESKRRITPVEAGTILRQVPNGPKVVGVFVNPTLEELEDTLSQARLDVIQLHGQERPDFCQRASERFGVTVWKAIPVSSEEQIVAQLEQYASIVDAFLFDTHDPQLAGGTGKRFSWEQIPLLRKQAGRIPSFIAGGINERNITELLCNYQPFAIDVSSGVETDGEKDHEKIKRFLQRVRENE